MVLFVVWFGWLVICCMFVVFDVRCGVMGVVLDIMVETGGGFVVL